MTEASHNVFVDRRTDEEMNEGLATPILYWYDNDKKGRTRTNGVAISTEGRLLIARSTCSKKDQFIKSKGRMIVAKRMFGNAKTHCWELIVEGADDVIPNIDTFPTLVATVFDETFANDEAGRKRAYNAARVFVRYRADLQRRATEMLDDFEDSQS